MQPHTISLEPQSGWSWINSMAHWNGSNNCPYGNKQQAFQQTELTKMDLNDLFYFIFFTAVRLFLLCFISGPIPTLAHGAGCFYNTFYWQGLMGFTQTAWGPECWLLTFSTLFNHLHVPDCLPPTLTPPPPLWMDISHKQAAILDVYLPPAWLKSQKVLWAVNANVCIFLISNMCFGNRS